MKKIIFFYFLVTTGFMSCNDKLDLVEDAPSVPIIYSILDPTESIHYVRINKSFNGIGSPYDMAKYPDSILFGDLLDIKVMIIDNKNEDVVKELNFKRINMKKDSVNREGKVVFAVEKHYVYINEDGTFPYDNDYVYKLEVRLQNGDLIALAETNELYKFNFLSPADSSMVKFWNDRPISTGWSRGYHTGLVTSDITIYYYEHNWKEKRYYIKTLKTKSKDLIPVKALGYGYSTDSLFIQLEKQIKKDDSPDIDYRYIIRMTVNYMAVNADVAEYMSHFGDAPSNYYENQQLQPLSNIKGGFGLFGAKITGKKDPVFFDEWTRLNFSTLHYYHYEYKVNANR